MLDVDLSFKLEIPDTTDTWLFHVYARASYLGRLVGEAQCTLVDLGECDLPKQHMWEICHSHDPGLAYAVKHAKLPPSCRLLHLEYIESRRRRQGIARQILRGLFSTAYPTHVTSYVTSHADLKKTATAWHTAVGLSPVLQGSRRYLKMPLMKGSVKAISGCI
jgi:hypothetical protein